MLAVTIGVFDRDDYFLLCVIDYHDFRVTCFVKLVQSGDYFEAVGV